jgi:hypothetical protein
MAPPKNGAKADEEHSEDDVIKDNDELDDGNGASGLEGSFPDTASTGASQNWEEGGDGDEDGDGDVDGDVDGDEGEDEEGRVGVYSASGSFAGSSGYEEEGIDPYSGTLPFLFFLLFLLGLLVSLSLLSLLFTLSTFHFIVLANKNNRHRGRRRGCGRR